MLLGAHTARIRRKRRGHPLRFPAAGATGSVQVSQCTDYEDKRIPTRKDMEDIAWIIRTKDVNRQVGFTNDAEPEPEEDELEIVPSE